jgi:hypothetical protein
MISYISAVNNDNIYYGHLYRSLHPLPDGDELIDVRGFRDAGEAYNHGVSIAKNDIKCFIHQDIVVIDPEALRSSIVSECMKDDVGIVGLIGTTDRNSCPWWANPQAVIGSIIHTLGLILGHRNGGDAAILDGLLLATAKDVVFDEGYKAFHWYAHDICQQMLEAGFTNRCLSNGRKLAVHNCNSQARVDQQMLDTMRVYCGKWDIPWPEDYVRQEYGI